MVPGIEAGRAIDVVPADQLLIGQRKRNCAAIQKKARIAKMRKLAVALQRRDGKGLPDTQSRIRGDDDR